jgi:Dolichyl-phosphate-mannose-protein mannosyltransferase
MRIRCTSTLILLALLVIHAALLGWGAVVHSPTIDEVEWLPGGLAQWKTGRGDLVVRNPPHLGLVAAIPLLFADPDMTALESAGNARSIGREFIRTNGRRSFWLFTLGRWACIPFSIIGAVTCFTWAKELYGPKSGLLAATLWCFSPNILAHGQLVAHDVAATSLGLVACYAFWRWLRQSSLKTTALAGVCLGLALLTKMTLLIYLVLWPLMWIAWCFGSAERPRSGRHWLTRGALLAAILVLALDVLNLGYGFHGSFARLDSYTFRSQALAGSSDGRGNRFADTIVGKFPVPFPRPFLIGLDIQRFALEGGMGARGSYLRGEWSSHPTPYYYLYALAIKVPLGTWCLLLLAIIFRIRRMDAANRACDETILLAPAVAILLVASSSTGLTYHVRYVLPCFPFVFIWISRLANLSWSAHRWFGSLGIAALAWAVLSSLWVYPHSMSYFNEIIGGPRYGHYHLASSDIDYGQDLLNLKRWYDQHPEARPLGLAYWDLESVDPQIAGIEYFVPPSGPAPGAPVEASEGKELGPMPGWYAVNVNLLHADRCPGREVYYPDLGFYGYFLEFTPVARAGYSILIYHISPNEANRVRARLGLPRLEFDH